MNANRKRIFVALATVIAVACAVLFVGIYREAENAAVKKLDELQVIYARQAARGIEEYFQTWTGNLNALAQISAVAAGGEEGSAVLKLFYETNEVRIREITRLDETGVIRADFPDSGAVGTDISQQKHVIELLRDHKPVISDVFRSVEGVESVVLHVPVFRGSKFRGSVGILVDFKSLAKRYLDVIRIGETGYAWLLSRDGTIFYTPEPGLTGRSILEIAKDNPSYTGLAAAMLQGREGTAEYISQGIGAPHASSMRKYAVYLPIRIGGTFWSICVASSEEEVFADLSSFRNRLALLVGVFFIVGVALSTLGARAWLIAKEEEKNAQAKLEIAQQRNQLAHLSRVSMLGELSGSIAHELNQPLTAILSNAQAAEIYLNHSEPDLGEVRAILKDIAADDRRARDIILRLRLLLKRGEVLFQANNANDLVLEVLKLLHNDLIDRGVIARSELAAKMPLLQADRGGIQQVLINLVTNACDAMAETPVEDRYLTIRTGLEGNDTVLISVSDNGVGIAEESLERVFDSFFTSKANGMGLGLTVCRTIVNAHGGRLWAVNNPTRGTTFYLRLPLSGENRRAI